MENKPLVYKGMRTPWGQAQSAQVLIEGIGMVSTAGHGGLKLSAARNRRIPKYAHDIPGGWYEEDCACLIPLAIFKSEILADPSAPQWLKDSLAKSPPENGWRSWFPDSYEQYFGVKLQPGESRIRDEANWRKAHANDYVACSAWGDWQNGVPQGMVGLWATPGGERTEPAWQQGKYFLVDAAEYDARTGFGFVIDPARHQEVPDFTEGGTQQ